MTKGQGGLACSLGALVVAACAATGGWENPQVPRERWVADAAACRRHVEARVDRAHTRDPLTRGPGGVISDLGRPSLGYDRGPDAYSARLALYEAGKLRTRLVGECMTERGYTRIGAAKKS